MGTAIDRTELALGDGMLQVYRVEPGCDGLSAVIEAFASSGGGTVTSLDDATLKLAAPFIEPDSDITLESFGGLVGIVCGWLGVPRKKVGRRTLVEATVAHACRTVGKIFKPRIGAEGLSQTVTATLSELRYAGATPESLREMAFGLVPSLRSRIEELAAILEHSDATLRMLSREHLSDQLQRVVQSSPIGLPSFEAPGRILVFGMQDLTPLHAEWLLWLARAGTEVSVVIESQSIAVNGPLFSRPLSLLRIEPKPSNSSEPSGRLSTQLFGGQTQANPDPNLEIVAAADPLAECEWALRACAQALAEGLSASDLAVSYRDESYGPLLSAASRRLGVPVCLRTRAPLLANRLVAFMLALLKAFVSDDVRDLVEPLASAYAELDPQALILARKFLREAHPDPNAWNLVEEAVNSGAPWAPAWLEAALEGRREYLGQPSYTPPLQGILNLEEMTDDGLELQQELHDASGPEAVPASEWVQRIRTLVELLPILDADRHEATDWDNRAQSVMIQRLTDEASVDKVRQRPPMNFGEAVRWCDEVWSRSDCSVPAGEGITVSSSPTALPQAKRIWALGMNDGRFPKRLAADPVLPDWERKLLQEAGLNLPTSAESHHGREREEFVRVCSAATERLILSYSLTVDDRESGPSSFVAEAQRVAGTWTERVEKQLVPETENCLLERDLSLRMALDSERVFPGEVEVSPETAKSLSMGPSPRLKMRNVMAAKSCAFRFQADRLHLVDVGIRSFKNALARLPAAANLPLIQDPKTAQAHLLEQLENLLDRLKGQAEPWEIRMHRLYGQRYIEELIEREFKARELLPRTIDPAAPLDFAVNIQLDDGSTFVILDRLDAVGQIRGQKSFHVYRSSRVRTSEEGLYEKYLSDVARVYGEDQGRGAVVEADSRGLREVFSSPPLSGIKDPRFKALVLRQQAFESVFKDLETVAKVTKSGSMTPTPSPDSCKFCDFGELCRRSVEFSEMVSPFDGPPMQLGEGDGLE